MRRHSSILVGLVAVFVTLAWVGAASAAVTPSLAASWAPRTTLLSYSQGGSDDPLARLVLFAPADYLASFAQGPGDKVGTATAKVSVGDGGAAAATLTGSIAVATAADNVTVGGQTLTMAAAAAACTGAAVHNAYWVIGLGGSQSIQVPVYVDFVLSGPYSGFAASTITICMPPPDVPAGTVGRAVAGTKLLDLSLVLEDVYSVLDGWYLWHGLTTPYSPGTGKPNAAGNVESQSVARTPNVVTVSSKTTKGGSVSISGRLTSGGKGIGGQTVTITAGGKSVATAKTNGQGRYGVTVAQAAGTLVATATVAAKSIPCQGTYFTPTPCSGSSYGGFTISSDSSE